MKLTKKEIKFIDNYLLKNEVKYWDVRLELLDHIVSAIEEKLIHDGISFNEALLEVHMGFGNQLIKESISKNKLWTKGLYQSNNGFKKFTLKKQKELNKGYTRQFFKLMKASFLKVKFYIELFILVIILFLVYNVSPKVAAFLSLGLMCIPYLFAVFLSLKNSFSRKSLSLNVATSSFVFIVLLPITVLNFFDLGKDINGTNSYEYLIIFFFLFYIPSRIMAKLFHNIYTQLQLNYKDLVVK